MIAGGSIASDESTAMNQAGEMDFPSVEQANADGLLMLGGELNAAWLLSAYQRGIFPWPLDDLPDTPTAWWSPDPRAVIEWDGFHISRSLQRTLRSTRFDLTFDCDFEAVIRGCAAPRALSDGVWLTKPLIDAFIELHDLGFAHSVEVWHQGQLAGGIYGLALGGYFSAESMFYKTRDASKVALVHLVQRLRAQGFLLLDVQVLTEHTQRMGATEIPRSEFLSRLAQAQGAAAIF